MDNKKACNGCLGSNYYDYNREYFPRTGKYPYFEKYENATGGSLSAYICELTLQGYADNEIAVKLGVRWSYLFNGLTFFDWSHIVEEYREIQKEVL